MRLISGVWLEIMLLDVSHVLKTFSRQCFRLFLVRMATTELTRPPCADFILTRCLLTYSTSNSVLVTNKFVIVIKLELKALTFMEQKILWSAIFATCAFFCLQVAFRINIFWL